MWRVVRLGAAWALVVGVPAVAVGAIMLGTGLVVLAQEAAGTAGCTPNTRFACNLARGLAEVGPVVIAIGSVHLGAAVGMWQARTWGRWLGVAVGTAGIAASVWIWARSAGDLLPLVPVTGYGLTLVGALGWYAPDDLAAMDRPDATQDDTEQAS